MTGEDLNRMDILLMLLHAPGPTGRINEPIRGRTRLQKELFLAQKQLSDEGVRRPYGFRPYIYGPYSRELYNDIEWLKSREIIREKRIPTSDEGIYVEFGLTPNGIKRVEAMIRNRRLERTYEVIRVIKQKHNRMDLTQLVELTHRLFPEYVGPRT